jgi:hypothetical protein
MVCGECFVMSYVYIGFRRHDTPWFLGKAIVLSMFRAITIYLLTNTLSEHGNPWERLLKYLLCSLHSSPLQVSAHRTERFLALLLWVQPLG